MTIFQHKILDALLYAQRLPLASDFEIFFNNINIPCHKAIVSQSSNLLKNLIQQNRTSYQVDDYVEASQDDIIALIRCFYGQPLHLSNDNALSLFLLAKSLSCSELETECKSVVKSSTASTHTKQLSTLLSQLSGDTFRDYCITYNQASLNVHSFLLASVSPYFYELLTKKQCEKEQEMSQSNGEVSHKYTSPAIDFSKTLKVSCDSLFNLLRSLYDGSLEITLDNVFEFYHLSKLFKMQELNQFCCDYMVNSEAEYSWITASIMKAVDCKDHEFIKFISPKISEIRLLSERVPIATHPLFFENLNANIDVSWLLRCLVHSHLNYPEENVWTPSTLNTAFTSIKTDSLSVASFFNIIEPLFSVNNLFEFCSPLCLSMFASFPNEIPLPWYLWYIAECDSRKEFNLLSQAVTTVDQVVTFENVDKLVTLCLSSESLVIIASSTRKEHLILWIIKSLIDLWTKSKLKVEEFSRILLSLSLEETNFELVYGILGKLFSDQDLRTILLEFVSIKLVPRIVQDSHTEKKALRDEMGRMQDELNAIKIKNEALSHSFNELSLKFSQQQQDLNLLKNMFNSLKRKGILEDNDINNNPAPIPKDDGAKQSTVEDCEADNSTVDAEEEVNENKSIFHANEEPLLRQHGQVKQNDEVVLVSSPKLVVTESKGGAVFDTTKKGHYIVLRDFYHSATKVQRDCWVKSFVAIQLPRNSNIVLTLTKSGLDFSSMIGWFAPQHVQTGKCLEHLNALAVDREAANFYVNRTIVESCGVVSVGQSVVCSGDGTFSLPHSGFKHQVDVPKGYIFGLLIFNQGTSWSLSDE
ncbi:hypothetical protein RCL1_000231 [Eukaryota sp. TZLM3-RCL]